MWSARLAFTTKNASPGRWTPHKAWLRIRPVRQHTKDLVEVLVRIEAV